MSKSEWLQNVALLVLVYAIRMYKQTLFHNYEPEGPLPKYQCTPMLGFDKTDHYYATEDTEVNYELNLMAISIGFRENLFKEMHAESELKNKKREFSGIYFYNLADLTESPVKIEIPNANLHGIDMYKLSDSTMRLFAVSHQIPDYLQRPGVSNLQGSEVEEVIYFDYNFVTREKISKIFRVRSKLLWSSNDVVATAPNKILASQYNFWPWDNHHKNLLMALATLSDWTGVSYVEFEDSTDHQTPSSEIAEIRPVTFEKMAVNYVANANGLKYDFETKKIYLNQHSKFRTAVYNWNYLFPKEPASFNKFITYEKGLAPDNLSFSPDKKFMYVSGFNNAGKKIVLEKAKHLPSVVLKVDLKDDSFVPLIDDKEGMYSASTAVEYGDKLIVSSPYKNAVICAVEN